MIIKKISGALLIVFGLLLGSWVYYNLFVHLTEEARPHPPGPAIFLSAACIVLGCYKLTNDKLFEYHFWRKREFQKWLSAGLGLLLLAYVVNMILRYRDYSIVNLTTLLHLGADLFSLYIIGKLFLLFFRNILNTKEN